MDLVSEYNRPNRQTSQTANGQTGKRANRQPHLRGISRS
ncbi:hypothetical protein D3OALGA1CA_1471 [Olavius algarvensis associated proteobacterium Delta 3]|nr:hypothetical protein D3OALGB2SA_919 [Olavius algarvensis associated proteobacterium Delta 3]CAB5101570.1 hypothetical protein D3OALGA1CA_1471 [Olavius algarvensis associated proteobacterium Delta 3]